MKFFNVLRKWRYRFVLLFAIYIAVLSLFILVRSLNSALLLFIGRNSIGYQLQFLSIGSSVITLIGLQMAITERHSRFIRVLILIAAFGFAALYFDIRYSVLPFGDNRPLYYLFAVLLFAIFIFWYDLKYSKEDPTLKKAIVWGLDLPLVVGFAFVMFFTGKLMQTQVILPQEASLFIGGATAFVLGYYHAGYSFLKVSFRQYP